MAPKVAHFGGHDISFPYPKAYLTQKRVMHAIINALNEQENVVIESPTGSGKSMAMLCATLSWNRMKGRKIFVLSRTHAQLKQLVSEFKKAGYKSSGVILASRDHYCINTKINTTDDVSNSCKLVNTVPSKCTYRAGSTKLATYVTQSDCSIVDIEDLIDIGSTKSRKGCPYYAAKHLAQTTAEVVFMPYEYVLNPAVFKSTGIFADNSILIIDEAHNVEGVCCEVSSFIVSTQELDDLLVLFIAGNNESSFIWKLLKGLKDLASLGDTTIGSHETLVCLVCDSGITDYSVGKCIQLLDELNSDSNFNRESRSFLQSLRVFLLVFLKASQGSFRFTVENNVITVLCLDPRPLFELSTTGYSSIVLMSGTLNTAMASRLSSTFHRHYVCKTHCVPSSRILPRIIQCSPKGLSLKGNYVGWNTLEFRDHVFDLIFAIVSRKSRLGGGILVFLPSFTVMEKLVSEWRASGKWVKLLHAADIVVSEPKSSKRFHEVLTAYMEQLDTGSCGIMLAVFRGKISEGMNFSDQYARVVITIGIPYPTKYAPRILMTQEYLNSISPGSGDVWYRMQAFTALNQALGRCLRHKDDFGAVLIVDSRLKATNSDLSTWIRMLAPPIVKSAEDFSRLICEMEVFFQKFSKERRVYTQWGRIPRFTRLDLCHNRYTSGRSCPTGFTIAPAT